MQLSIEPAWIFLVALLMVRVGAVVLSTPLDGMGQMPVMVKSLLVFICAAFLVTHLDLVNKVRIPDSVWLLGILALQELALSLCLAVGMHAATSTFIMAGRLMDNQAGFSAAAVFNPALNMEDSLLGTLLTAIAVIAFFSFNFHLVMLKGIIFSVEAIPPGQFAITRGVGMAIKLIGTMFGFGLAMAAPVIFILFVIDGVVGIISKTMPQMNVYFVSLPIKMFVALAVLALSIAVFKTVIYRIFMTTFDYWDGFLRAGLV